MFQFTIGCKLRSVRGIRVVVHILVVDDERTIVELLTIALEGLGHHKVTSASRGTEALAIINKQPNPFDLLLLDVQMPEMTGIELCRRVRETPGYRATPIVIISAMAERDYVQRAHDAGANDYIFKPFDVLELEERLMRIARKSQDD